MLTRRCLKLVAGTDVQEAELIRVEQLQQHQRGLAVMAEARQQADVLLDEARQQAHEAIAVATGQAEQQFWRQADEILRGWQQEREQMENWLVARCGQLLTDAMTQILKAVPDAERYPALLRQLLRTQGGEGRGTLYCHPDSQADVAAWLTEHSHLGWKLSSDDALAQDTLKLITAQGVMTLSWQRAVEQLLPQTEMLSLN
ncbi:type III secretion system stator protein SctL [Dickeya dadantii]|uniref:type III secretion system stator protein SctL n=1 Tax=Dickeya dadantii TaxID=204038 RepID=UPI0013722F35|nr:type III secretion system stator protein SctL [Dickeya dadantii]NAT79349.1 HrpE/YscL family type III secretion apparatus protein [Dickeya dadantii]NPE64741.1 type III secretion system stator protein SctL [Dickeya dadantii]